MAPPRASSAGNITTTYSLSLLSEYTHTLDSLPLDLSRNFADLRELDAVLSSSMGSITTRINALTKMIEDGSVPKEERLWLLTEIAEEATRLKLGGEDKIRVACQAADNLKSHTGHLRTILEHLPGFDLLTLNRRTTYPHVAARSFMPIASLESGRRRRGGFGSMLVSAPEPSPAKRKRQTRDEDMDVKSPRKEKPVDSTSHRSRNGARAKKNERGASPAESLLSVTSHMPPQAPQIQASSSRQGTSNSSQRVANGSSNKRSRTSANQTPITPITLEDHLNSKNEHNNSHSAKSSRREGFNAPPSSSATHPSLPLPYPKYTNGVPSSYDLIHPQHSHSHPSIPTIGDWASTHPPHTQLEGPGMPVARATSSIPGFSVPSPLPPIGDVGEGTPIEGDGEAEGDDMDMKTYCFCDGVSYGEMIACDENSCEREWFHLACIGLEVPPEGRWFCETCRTKRNAKRAGRGGKRRSGTSRAGAKTKVDHD